MSLAAPANQHASTRSLLEQLRDITPRRALTHRQAVYIAERQAGLMRQHLGLTNEPLLPTEALETLPFMTVTYRPGFPTSGMATRTDLGWIIVIRSDEAPTRQRFSLCHELKHLIDDPFMHHTSGSLARGLYPDDPNYPTTARAERVCDIFAAALLMPKARVVEDWTSGTQDHAALARRYAVSPPAMHYRLQAIGLIPQTPRCAPHPPQGARR